MYTIVFPPLASLTESMMNRSGSYRSYLHKGVVAPTNCFISLLTCGQMEPLLNER